MPLRPKLFLDTNVCINVANGTIPAKEWNRVCKHINARYRYYISFVTLKELLSKLARGANQYFEGNKIPLRVLYGRAKRAFLPYPSVFALRTVLDFQAVARKGDTHNLSEEVWSETILKAVLDAPSKAQLKTGIPVRKSRKPMMQTFDLDDFDSGENEPQNEHADLLQGMLEGRINTPDPTKWAAWILVYHDLTPYREQCEQLVASLDAAYQFGCTLSKMVKDKGYDFRAHASDWGDSLQLMYLCDESMHFLTFDVNCRNHARQCPQASRILLYREFVRTLA